jgi:hypothetical protein
MEDFSFTLGTRGVFGLMSSGFSVFRVFRGYHRSFPE